MSYKQYQSHLHYEYLFFKLRTVLKTCYTGGENNSLTTMAGSKFRRSENTRIKDAVQALALCHNVTPVYETSENSETSKCNLVISHSNTFVTSFQQQRKIFFSVAVVVKGRDSFPGKDYQLKRCSSLFEGKNISKTFCLLHIQFL